MVFKPPSLSLVFLVVWCRRRCRDGNEDNGLVPFIPRAAVDEEGIPAKVVLFLYLASVFVEYWDGMAALLSRMASEAGLALESPLVSFPEFEFSESSERLAAANGEILGEDEFDEEHPDPPELKSARSEEQ